MSLNAEVIKIINRPLPLSKRACEVMGVAVFIGLTFLGAYVRIYLPFTPVPITLQTFFVLLSGAVLGRRLGSISQAGYIILGSLGLPIFAGATGGILYLLGPTGGYLIGFIAASYIVGGMINMKKELTFGWTILAMLTGMAVVYLLGASWLSFVIKSNFSQTFVFGVLPFIPGAVLKLSAAAIIFYTFLQPRLNTDKDITKQFKLERVDR